MLRAFLGRIVGIGSKISESEIRLRVLSLIYYKEGFPTVLENLSKTIFKKLFSGRHQLKLDLRGVAIK